MPPRQLQRTNQKRLAFLTARSWCCAPRWEVAGSAALVLFGLIIRGFEVLPAPRDADHTTNEPPRVLTATTDCEGIVPSQTKQERDMTHELDVNELDAVSGGLRDIHQQDLICQRQAD